MPVTRRELLAALGSATTASAGCAGSPGAATHTGTPTVPPTEASYAYTHLQPSGNRFIPGRSSIADADPVDIAVDGRPAWLLAFGNDASYWTIVTTDGTATTHRVSEGRSERVGTHDRVPQPPLAFRADGDIAFVDRPADCADFTHPVVSEDRLVYVAADGDLVIRRADGNRRLSANAPVDARLVAVDADRYALYGAQTDRYRHGALGDSTEGGSLLVVDAASGTVDVEVTLDPPAVFEGLWPLVADVDGDGDSELVTTVSDSTAGARIRVYGADGRELATGPVYGSGWRHQLCVAPFGPDGRPELAVVRKPHVDRTVEFYRLADGELTVTATARGYASHTYGSRNVDGALAADLDDDGRRELLVPTTDRRTLATVRRTDTGIETPWSLALGGSLATNVTGVALEGDRLAVGAGTPDGVRVWQG
ncbi:hypothetical protein [Halobellus ordinarius]|uniref:hypothetical protein n=1 Tax=Halobellus ordinarius TaxID=3075120 RepID=UPI002880B895|nr:hypothetical protein [Halobellus sp. ZY16]